MAIRVINDIVSFQEELEAQAYNEVSNWCSYSWFKNPKDEWFPERYVVLILKIDLFALL